MQLKNRLNHLEQRAKAVNAAKRQNDWGLDWEQMSEVEIDTLLKNLLIASGKPQDAAAGRVWDKLCCPELGDLTPDEWATLLTYYQSDEPITP